MGGIVLGPGASDRSSVRAQLALVAAVDDRYRKFDGRFLKADGGDGHAIGSLVDTVEHGAPSTLVRLRDLQDGAEPLARLKGALPCSGEVLRLCGGSGQYCEADEPKHKFL